MKLRWRFFTRKKARTIRDEIRRMGDWVARFPRKDHRSGEELIGCDKQGLSVD